MSQPRGTRYGRLDQGGSVVWLTPPQLLAALGPFDLDPCAAVNQPWRTARVQYTEDQDGLSRPWFGLVWCNPPYGRGIERWMSRLAEHGRGIALVPARTETRWFQELVWPRSHGVHFLAGRPRFHHPDGQPAKTGIPLPVCLVAYGSEGTRRLRRSQLAGSFVVAQAITPTTTTQQQPEQGGEP